MFRLFHLRLGFMPFIASLHILLYLVIARAELGHFPSYGEQPDPSALGYDWLYIQGSMFELISFFTAPVWLGATLFCLVEYGKKFKISILQTVLFFAGAGTYVFLRLLYQPVLLWYFD